MLAGDESREVSTNEAMYLDDNGRGGPLCGGGEHGHGVAPGDAVLDRVAVRAEPRFGRRLRDGRRVDGHRGVVRRRHHVQVS